MSTISRLPPGTLSTPVVPAQSRAATSSTFASKVQAPSTAQPAAQPAAAAQPEVTGADIMKAFREMMLQQGSAIGNATLSLKANVSIDS